MKRLIMILAVGSALTLKGTLAQATCIDDFEPYDVGTWPSNWVPDANVLSDPGNNYVAQDPLDPGNKTLRLFGSMGGCWSAEAYYPITFGTNFTVQARMYNGSGTLTGCHPYRGMLVMRHGTYWYAPTNPVRELIRFRDGEVTATDGTILQTYETERWYDVKVHYQRQGTHLSIGYCIDGVDLAEVQVTIDDLEKELSLDHLNISAQEGAVYFDTIQLTQLAPIPEPAGLGVVGLGLVGLARRKRRS